MDIFEELKGLYSADGLTEDDEIDDTYHGSWARGATKAVFIPDDENIYDEVFKVPYTGTYDSLDGDYEDFCRAGYGLEDYNGSSWDYCEAELEIYRRAEADGVEELFAEMHYIGECNDLPLYSQERCLSFYEEGGYAPEKYIKTADKMLKEDKKYGLYKFDKIWIARVIETFGEVMCERLSNFIERLDLADFHSDNYGYSLITGKPIIFDYAGFND